MRQILIELGSVFVGTLGFTLLFRVRNQLIGWAAIGAVLSWAVYLLLHSHTSNIFVSCLIASVAAATYSEMMARIHKAPATIFLIIALIPSIPGGALYYTLLNAVRKNWNEAVSYGIITLKFGMAIAIGISLVWAIGIIIIRIRETT